MVRLIILNCEQIAGLLRDFIADNAKEIFHTKRVVSSGTYSILNKNNVRMLCDVSRSDRTLILNDSELEMPLMKLPHTGFKCFEMSDKQIKDAINGGRKLKVEDLNFLTGNYVNNKNFRLMTLDKKEMRDILYGQTFEFFVKAVGFQTDSFNIGMQVNFDGEKSKLVFFQSDKPFDIDWSALDADKVFPAFSDRGFDYKYAELNDDEFENLIFKV